MNVVIELILHHCKKGQVTYYFEGLNERISKIKVTNPIYYIRM